MKHLKRYKVFEASVETISGILTDFKELVEFYLQDEFDYIDFEVNIDKGPGTFFADSHFISLWISSIKCDSRGHLKTFKVSELLPAIENINVFMKKNGLEFYHLISDTPNKPTKSRNKLEFPYDDVTRVYLTWK